MSGSRRRDRGAHFLVYLVAGAAMGGFLDVFVFGLRTPIYGMMGGVVIATLYQTVIWLRQRR